MRSEDVGPALEHLALDACRLAAGLVEAAEAEALRRRISHGRIAVSARFVRALIAARQLRPERFGALLVPDTGWSLMLALYAARLEGWELTRPSSPKPPGPPPSRPACPPSKPKASSTAAPTPKTQARRSSPSPTRRRRGWGNI